MFFAVLKISGGLFDKNMTVIKILNLPEATIIPCLHVESGCSGLFNTITNEFYPVKIAELEYVQNAEAQYIDTGVYPTGEVHDKR